MSVGDNSSAHNTSGKQDGLSLCMIVKNESAVLGRCLQSVRACIDECIVVDTGSTDDTREIARSFGATVIDDPWKEDFAAARNVSIEHASCRWILWLDADDVVPPGSVPSIDELKTAPADRVLSFIVRNQKRSGTGSEFVQARMFPNDPRLRFERRIHEQITLSALRIGMPIETRPVVIEHHGYDDPHTTRKKALRNIDLLTREVEVTPDDPVLMVEIGDSYQLVGDDEHARGWYERVRAMTQARERMPLIVSQACLGAGVIDNRAGRYTEAIETLREACRLSGDRPDALFSLAVSLENANRPDEAIAILERILDHREGPSQVGIDFRETRIKTVLRLIRLCGEQGAHERALAAIERARREYPARPEPSCAAGIYFLRTGKLIDALHAFEQSLECAVEGNIDSYIGLCFIYHKAGKQAPLEKTMETMKKLFPGYPRFWAFHRMVAGNSDDIPGEIDLANIDEQQRNIIDAFGTL